MGEFDLSDSDGVANRPPVRSRRLAEVVADQIRERIVRGDLVEGDLLPKESQLRAQYPVSVQSLREAMRILETEGIVQVRRGNQGGAVVHPPTAGNVAYSLSMVLARSRTSIDDIGRALEEVEPLCAALCARRSDRAHEVIPILRRIHDESLARVDDLLEATTASRHFHEAVVNYCGNEPLIVMVGALESLWSSHVTNWATWRANPSQVPPEERLAALEVHGTILRKIEEGDSHGAWQTADSHLRDVSFYPSYPQHANPGLDPKVVRNRLFFEG